MKRDACERPNFLRNRASYEKDIKAQDFLKTGIKSDCLFNELKTFHVTENFYFDLMHDVLKGVCVYSVCQTLTAFSIKTHCIHIWGFFKYKSRLL